MEQNVQIFGIKSALSEQLLYNSEGWAELNVVAFTFAQVFSWSSVIIRLC